MPEEVRFIYKRGLKTIPEEIAMIEAAGAMPVEQRAVAERNRRISKRQV